MEAPDYHLVPAYRREPNWAMAYAHLVRHVSAAHALAETDQDLACRRALQRAMEVIVQFETIYCLIPNASNP